jgi:hypothetical protein
MAGERRCPSCREPMERRGYDRKPLGRVELDVCFGCHALWLDQHESMQLTPAAVLQVFRIINEHRERPARPLGENPRCPECRRALAPTQDVQRHNRISYHRCPQGHGRLTTFFQFLREKNFVRSLSPGELEQLKVHVAQVRCSSCGAPVSLERDAQCGYCRAPVSILDAQAVTRTIAQLTEEERRRQRVDPAILADGLLEGRRFERRMAGIESRGMPSATTDVVDLVAEALGSLLSK